MQGTDLAKERPRLAAFWWIHRQEAPIIWQWMKPYSYPCQGGGTSHPSPVPMEPPAVSQVFPGYIKENRPGTVRELGIDVVRRPTGKSRAAR